MIYAAEINIDNIVQRVIVAPSIAWCVDTLGGRWVQTFMDGAVRGKYAGVGDTYDEDQDEFVSPIVEIK
jgi:hypothetical protein